MSSDHFLTTEHVIPASFVRGFARGLRDERSPYLRLSIKQYKPINNPQPQLGDPTIIFTHGTGIARESYEPMFDALVSDTTFVFDPYGPLNTLIMAHRIS